jgi:hypothetical protein
MFHLKVEVHQGDASALPFQFSGSGGSTESKSTMQGPPRVNNNVSFPYLF